MTHKPRKDMPSQKSNVSKQSWFDGNCMNARKKYHKAKRVYRHIKNEETLSDLKHSSKSYRNIIKFSVDKYKKAFNNMLRLLKVSNFRDYWKFYVLVEKRNCY